MRCLGIDIKIVSGFCDSVVRTVNDLCVSVSYIREKVSDTIAAGINRVSDFNVCACLVSGDLSFDAICKNTSISVQVTTICEPNVGAFYLEIEPELLWVYPDIETYNKVISNTDWIII